jgi:hypothetical protein
VAGKTFVSVWQPIWQVGQRAMTMRKRELVIEHHSFAPSNVGEAEAVFFPLHS